MKNHLLFTWLAAAAFLICLPSMTHAQVPIDETYFPDSVFRKYVQDNFDTDGNGDLSQEECQAVKEIDLSRHYSEPKGLLSDLSGIEFFPALEILSCRWTRVSKLDLRQNPNLVKLDCSSTHLVELDVSHNPKLEVLDCSFDTALVFLDLRYNEALKYFSCIRTELEKVDVSHNPKLEVLECSYMRLWSLDVSRNPLLKTLNCGNVSIDHLDLSQNPALEVLLCFGSPYLHNLDVSHNPNLVELHCQNSPIRSLDVSHNPALKDLDCTDTEITSLDLSQNREIESLTWGEIRREVWAEVGGTYDLSLLPGFDVSRASDWKGGSVQGTVLTFNDEEVTYRYVTFYPGESEKVADTLEFRLVARSYEVPIVNGYFPDSVFRQYVKDNFDTDGNGVLSVKEGVAVTEINVEGDPNEGSPLVDLEGLEYFPYLKTLRCSNTSLKSLDVSLHTALTALDCSRTEITRLDVSQNAALKMLLCHEMYLERLDVSHNPDLELLVCYNTDIDSLDVSRNPALKVLSCASTKLTSLDVSQNPALVDLSCSRTGIKTLDVSQNPVLTYLDCAGTEMTSLDVSHNPALEELRCGIEGLKTLDLSRNTELTFLDCSYAGITKLDLTQNLKLKELWCAETSLTNLDISKNTELWQVLCLNSPLLSLDVSQNTRLQDLNCSGTALTSLDVSHNPELFSLSGRDIQRELKLAVGETYDLSQLPGFDVSRASGWSGGSVEGTILTFNDAEVTYQYTTLYSGSNTKVPEALEFKLVANPNLSLVSEPVFSPDSGSVVKKGDTIRLECVTEGAVIYYGLGEDAEPDQEYKAAEGIVISQDTTYLTAWAMLAGEDTSEVVHAVYYVKIEEPEPDTVHVVLPSGLEAKVDGNSVTLGWDSEEKHVYQLRVQGHGMQDTLGAEVESAGAYTEYRFTDLEEGTYSWAVRVIRVEETDTLSRYVEGEDFVIGEVSVDGELLSGIRLYPNPSSGSFQVEVGEAVRLDIFTAVGVRVLGRDLEPGTEALELSASGLYLLRFTTTDGRVAYRRMVVR